MFLTKKPKSSALVKREGGSTLTRYILAVWHIRALREAKTRITSYAREMLKQGFPEDHDIAITREGSTFFAVISKNGEFISKMVHLDNDDTSHCSMIDTCEKATPNMLTNRCRIRLIDIPCPEDGSDEIEQHTQKAITEKRENNENE